MNKTNVGEGVLNVFEDLGLPDSDELFLKAKLLREILGAIESRGFKQKDLIEHLGIKQPEASFLMNGKLSRFSRERLIDYMVKLGMTVELRVKKPKKNAPLKPGALIYTGAS